MAGLTEWRPNYDKVQKRLNPWQGAIRDRIADVQKPDWLRIVAAAGSGKTSVTVATVARIVVEGLLPPGSIFVTTFTNKAAAELRERLDAILPPMMVDKIRVGTFHALCGAWIRRNDPSPPSHKWGGEPIDGKGARIKAYMIGNAIVGFKEIPGTRGPGRQVSKPKLKRDAKGEPVKNERGRLVYEKNPRGKTVYEDVTVFEKAGLNLKDKYDEAPKWRDYAQKVGIFRSRGLTVADVTRAHIIIGTQPIGTDPWAIEGLTDLEQRAVETWLEIDELQGKSDRRSDDDGNLYEHFSGRLPHLFEVWSLYEEAKAGLNVYDFEDLLYAYWKRGTDQAALVMVDEAQDNAWIQLDIARQLAERSGGRLCLIGDGRQAIYSWRGADPSIFIEADKKLGAQTMEIPTNYRSGEHVVEAGNAISDGQPWSVGMPAIPERVDRRNDGAGVKPAGLVRVRRGDMLSYNEAQTTARDVATLLHGDPVTVNGSSAWDTVEAAMIAATEYMRAPETFVAQWEPQVQDGQTVGWKSSRGDRLRLVKEKGDDGQPTGRVQVKMGPSVTEIAVLCRTNKEAGAYEMAFLPLGIPVMIVGAQTSFFDSRPVMDALAMCLLSRKVPIAVGEFVSREEAGEEEATADAGHRGLTLVECVTRTWKKNRRFARFANAQFGSAVAQNLRAGQPVSQAVRGAIAPVIAERKTWGRPNWDQIERWQTDLDDYVGAIEAIEKSTWPDTARIAVESLVPSAVREAAAGGEEVETEAAEPSDADEGDGSDQSSDAEYVMAFGGIARSYPSLASLLGFAAQLSDKVFAISQTTNLSERDAERLKQERARRVTVSTIHASKGLEWKHVFVSATSGKFPLYFDYEDEDRLAEALRLFYVAVTRAKDVCTLTCAEKIERGAKLKIAGPGPFVTQYVEPYLKLVANGMPTWARTSEVIAAVTPDGFVLSSDRENYEREQFLAWSSTSDLEDARRFRITAVRGERDGTPNAVIGWKVTYGDVTVRDRGRDFVPTVVEALHIAGRAMVEAATGQLPSLDRRFDDFVQYITAKPGEARPGFSNYEFAQWLVENKLLVLDEFQAILAAGGDTIRAVMGWSTLAELWSEASNRPDTDTLKCDPDDRASGYAIWRDEFLGVMWRMADGRIGYRGSLALEKPAGRDLLGYGRLSFTRACLDNVEWPVSAHVIWPDRPSKTYTIRSQFPVYRDGTPEFIAALATYAATLHPPEGPVCTAPACKPPPLTAIGGGEDPAEHAIQAAAAPEGAPLTPPPGWRLNWRAPVTSATEAWWWTREDWYWLLHERDAGYTAVVTTAILSQQHKAPGTYFVGLAPREFYEADIITGRDAAIAHVLGLMQKYPPGTPVPKTEGRLFTTEQVRERRRAGESASPLPPPLPPPPPDLLVEAPPEPLVPAPRPSIPTGYSPVSAASYALVGADAPMDPRDVENATEMIGDASFAPLWAFTPFDPWQLGGVWRHPSGATVTATRVLFLNDAKHPVYEVRRNFRVLREPAGVYIGTFGGPVGPDGHTAVTIARQWIEAFGPESAPLAASTAATAAPADTLEEAAMQGEAIAEAVAEEAAVTQVAEQAVTQPTPPEPALPDSIAVPLPDHPLWRDPPVEHPTAQGEWWMPDGSTLWLAVSVDNETTHLYHGGKTLTYPTYSAAVAAAQADFGATAAPPKLLERPKHAAEESVASWDLPGQYRIGLTRQGRVSFSTSRGLSFETHASLAAAARDLEHRFGLVLPASSALANTRTAKQSRRR